MPPHSWCSPGGPVAAVVLVVLLVLLVLLATLLASARAKPGRGPPGALRGGREPRRRRPPPPGDDDDDFPWWSLALPPAAAMFRALRAEKLRAAEGAGGGSGDPVLRRRYPADYRRTDAISNHFTEEARVDCRVRDRPTPREAWARLRRRHAAAGAGAPAGPAGAEARREAVYAETRGGECNTFNPAFARWIIESTAGRGARVRDPSSGWGDRLIGALAAGAKTYHGFDPNPALREGYRRIVDELGGGDHVAFRVATAPYEDEDEDEDGDGGAGAALPAKADIVLTSPPYFDFEVYAAPGSPEAAGQSTERWPDFGSWADRMYRPYLGRAFRETRPGGWIVIYVEDIPSRGGGRHPLLELTRETLEGLGAKPAGRFGLEVMAAPPGGPAAEKKKAAGAAATAGRRPPRVRWAHAWRVPD